jgi:hypothetical protein
MAIVAIYWEIEHMDTVTASLYGEFGEDMSTSG